MKCPPRVRRRNRSKTIAVWDKPSISLSLLRFCPADASRAWFSSSDGTEELNPEFFTEPVGKMFLRCLNWLRDQNPSFKSGWGVEEPEVTFIQQLLEVATGVTSHIQSDPAMAYVLESYLPGRVKAQLMFYGETAGFQLRQTIQCHRAASLGWKVLQPYHAFMPGELLKRGIRFCSHTGFLQKNLLYLNLNLKGREKRMARRCWEMTKWNFPKIVNAWDFFKWEKGHNNSSEVSVGRGLMVEAVEGKTKLRAHLLCPM